MFDIGTTTMSSKGQIVIPAEVREGIRAGDRFVVIRSGNLLVLKPAKAAEANFAEDLIVADRVKQAWKEVDRGEVRKHESWNEFKKELDQLKPLVSKERTRSSRHTER